MAYTAIQLITNAFYKAKIRSRGFDTILGDDLAVGLDQLNKLLSNKVLKDSEIPYYSKFVFNTVVGVDTYFIPNIIDFSTVTFFINGDSPQNIVRYQTAYQSRSTFFGSARAMNIQSLPFNWHFERTLGGANLYLYFVPNDVYPIEMWGLFRLDPVALNQDLSLTLDLFYIDLLEFELAERLCTEYDFEVPQLVSKELAKIKAVLINQSAQLDTKAIKISTLDMINSSLNYADSNVGKGWRP